MADASNDASPFDWATNWLLDGNALWGGEGGYVNDPDDHGGATNWGVTQATYNEWRKGQGLPIAPVKELSRQTAKVIYRQRYWDAVQGDELAKISPKMALCVYDTAVQSSPVRGAKTLQRVVQAEQDGVIGKVTLACFRLRKLSRGEESLLEDYMDARRRFYAAIVFNNPTQRKFANGWRNRRNSLRQVIGLPPEDE